MNFWPLIQQAAGMDRFLLWFLLLFVVAAVALLIIKPDERLRIRTALVLFGLSVIGLLMAATLLSYGIGRSQSAFKWTNWAWRVLMGFAFVNVAGVLLFDVLLDAARLKPPRILRDLLV